MICASCGADATARGCLNPSCSSRSLTPPAFEAAALPPLARIHELEEALRRFGHHTFDCAVYAPTTSEDLSRIHIPACSCGLDAAKRGV